MGCLEGIIANITNNCEQQPTRGLVNSVMIGNRADFSFTRDVSNPRLITAIANESTKQFFNLSAYRLDIDAGFDIVVSDNLPESYLQYFKMEPWGENSDQIENLDGLEDIVVVVEREGGEEKNSGDGAFQIFGLEKGLFKSSATARANDNNGVPVYEFTSREGQGERFSRFIFYDTDYATTKAAFDALTTPGV